MKCPRNKIATVETLSEGHQAKALKAFDKMRSEPTGMSRAAGWGGKDGQATRRRQCIVWPTEKLTTTEIIVSILICHHRTRQSCAAQPRLWQTLPSSLSEELQHFKVLKL